mmetsp:Transcript_22675/g.69719  ORF Transcript_22675/g.69719 Transcript_22675/m.69719 type:complete len:341 (+) Transcript_22675:214-1236(+)
MSIQQGGSTKMTKMDARRRREGHMYIIRSEEDARETTRGAIKNTVHEETRKKEKSAVKTRGRQSKTTLARKRSLGGGPEVEELGFAGGEDLVEGGERALDEAGFVGVDVVGLVVEDEGAVEENDVVDFLEQGLDVDAAAVAGDGEVALDPGVGVQRDGVVHARDDGGLGPAVGLDAAAVHVGDVGLDFGVHQGEDEGVGAAGLVGLQDAGHELEAAGVAGGALEEVVVDDVGLVVVHVAVGEGRERTGRDDGGGPGLVRVAFFKFAVRERKVGHDAAVHGGAAAEAAAVGGEVGIHDVGAGELAEDGEAAAPADGLVPDELAVGNVRKDHSFRREGARGP